MPKPKKYIVANGQEVTESKLFQVKYERNGETCYGSVNFCNSEAEEQNRHGFAIIDDAILGTYNVVLFSDLTPIPMSSEYDVENQCMDDEYSCYVAQEYKKVQELSDSIEGFNKGKLFSVGVADGSAWYVVTKVNKKSVKVEWRNFCPDGWMDQVLGVGGSFPRDSIEPLCGTLPFRRLASR